MSPAKKPVVSKVPSTPGKDGMDEFLESFFEAIRNYPAEKLPPTLRKLCEELDAELAEPSKVSRKKRKR